MRLRVFGIKNIEFTIYFCDTIGLVLGSVLFVRFVYNWVRPSPIERTNDTACSKKMCLMCGSQCLF